MKSKHHYVLQQDNDPKHKNKLTSEWLKRYNINVLA